MRTLKALDSQYDGQVAILAVDADPFESAGRIADFWDRNGYSWPVAAAQREIVVDYKVISQSTKVAVDRNGVIRFREGYGTKNQGWWDEVFSDLLEG